MDGASPCLRARARTQAVTGRAKRETLQTVRLPARATYCCLDIWQALGGQLMWLMQGVCDVWYVAMRLKSPGIFEYGFFDPHPARPDSRGVSGEGAASSCNGCWGHVGPSSEKDRVIADRPGMCLRRARLCVVPFLVVLPKLCGRTPPSLDSLSTSPLSPLPPKG